MLYSGYFWEFFFQYPPGLIAISFSAVPYWFGHFHTPLSPHQLKTIPLLAKGYKPPLFLSKTLLVFPRVNAAQLVCLWSAYRTLKWLGILSVFHRHTSFIMLHFIALCRCCVFNKLKGCGNPALSKSIGAVFLAVFALFGSLLHSGTSHNILNFAIMLYLLPWSVIIDVAIVIVLALHRPCSYDSELIQVVFWLLHSLAIPQLSPSP